MRRLSSIQTQQTTTQNNQTNKATIKQTFRGLTLLTPKSWKGDDQRPPSRPKTPDDSQLRLLQIYSETMRFVLFGTDWWEGSHHEPTTIYEDSTGCISMSFNAVHHARTKHMDVRYQYVRERVQEGDLVLKHVRTDDQIADVLTKPLAGSKHKKFTDLMLNGLPTEWRPYK